MATPYPPHHPLSDTGSESTAGKMHAHPNAELLQSATRGFDFLFSNDIGAARTHFTSRDDPFHLMGLGVCAFLEAALGMESGLMTEASRCLALSEAGTRKHMRSAKPRTSTGHHGRFAHGLEWEILNADAVVLLGLTHALSESYMGYLQCMYSLNTAHSKFTKLYKTVFPNGLPPTESFTLNIPSISVSPSLPNRLLHKDSAASIASSSSSVLSVASDASAVTLSAPTRPPAPAPKPTSGFFSRWVTGASASAPVLPIQEELDAAANNAKEDGPVEDLIMAGTAFGFGLFNLVFSLLPKKVQGLAGFLGFKHDRKLALQALSLAAHKEDVHGVFAGLVLMTYYGVVLLLSGYQADEEMILREYKDIVDKIDTRYPEGALWILNRAKIMRMAYDANGAIDVLQAGLEGPRKHSFPQADMLLVFELAWTLLSQRRYQEAADTFLKITELNSWSHGTYYFIAAGCYFSLGNYEKAQTLLDAIADLINKKKINGKDLPTEVFIKKKVAFYKEKQLRKTGNENNYVESIKISPAEEIGIFWNNHARVSHDIAREHIATLSTLSPSVVVHSSTSASGHKSPAPSTKSGLSAKSPPTYRLPISPSDDLDNADELAVRALLLGIHHRTVEQYSRAREFLSEAQELQSRIRVSTWVGCVATFESAVLELKELENMDRRRARATDKSSNGSASGLAGEMKGLSIDTRTDEEDLSGPISEDERKRLWADALKSASAKLDVALGLATSSVDLSSRLDSRIAMLRDEIVIKKDMMGIVF